MAEKITKSEIVEKEKSAWGDIVKRMDYMVELVCARADKGLIKDSSNAMGECVTKYMPIYRQRLLLELGDVKE